MTEFVCPHCERSLLNKCKELTCTECGKKYPIIDGIYYFFEQKDIERYEAEERQYISEAIEQKTIREKERWLNFYIRRTPCEVLLLRSLNGKSGIDIGVGSGKNENFEHVYIKVTTNLVGVDVSPGALKKFKRNFPNCTAILASKLPYKKECFDFITASGVVHHIVGQSQNLSFFFSEWHRVLKKGGLFVSNDPNVLYPISLLMYIPNKILQKLKPGARGRVLYERPILYFGVKKMLSRTGFKNVSVVASTFCHHYMPEIIIKKLMRTESKFLLLFPFKFFGRWITIYAEKE